MKMKRTKAILSLIITLGLLVLLGVPASVSAAGETVVSIDPATAQAPEGSDCNVTLNVDNVTDFDAAQYDVTYDPLVIEVTDVTAGDIGGTPIPVAMWASVNSTTIRVINNVENTPGVSGSGNLTVIHFHVVGTNGESSSISLSNGILGDIEAQPIPAIWENGSVQIIATVTADFFADKTEVLVNQVVTFTASPLGGSGNYTYAWDFGDSGTSTEANPTHSYTSSENYTVEHTVTDIANGSDTETKTDYITVYDALVTGASSDINEAVVGEDISFISSLTGGKPDYTYSWDFGDNVTSTEANPTHNYAVSGTYNVSLTATDALGNIDDDTITVAIYKLGDADKNNTVEVLDLTHVEHIIIGDSGYVYTTWADANSSGDINALDLTAIELIIMQNP